MLKNYRKCCMGCCKGQEEQLHSFPGDPTRFAEWVRILGKKPNVKKPYLCNRHFKREHFFGRKLSKYALPNAEPNQSLNASKEVTESLPSSSNNSNNIRDITNSSEWQEIIELAEETENEISTNTIESNDENVINLVDDFEEETQVKKETQEKDVLNSECLENSDSNDGNKQISALKNALDRCLKQLKEEKKQKRQLKQEHFNLSQELEAYKKLTANLGSESSELKKHIMREVVQFLTEREEKDKVHKKSIYMIRTTGKYCDVNLINM